jgi:putative ABC transport system ATP-binding protein
MIHLKGVNKTYKGLAGNVQALINIDLHIAKGESVVVIGKSGSGKSTLLNIISGIDRPDSGELLINGTALHTLQESELAKWRGKNIGIVFQSYQLIPTLSAIDNVLFPMDLVSMIPPRERKQRATELLDNVGLGAKLKKFPNELSGGEAQRVAIARSLANDPPIVMADEPTGNLDSKTGDQIYQLFENLKKQGKNMIIVTHEHIRERNFEKIIQLQDGLLKNENELV